MASINRLGPFRNSSQGRGIYPIISDAMHLIQFMTPTSHKVQIATPYYILRYSQEDLDMAEFILARFKINVNNEIRQLIQYAFNTIYGSEYSNLTIRSNLLKPINEQKSISQWLHTFVTELIQQTQRRIRNGQRRDGFNVQELYKNLLNGIITKINEVVTISTVYSTKNLDDLRIYRGLYDAILIYMLRLFFGTTFLIPRENPNLDNSIHEKLMRELHIELLMPRIPPAKQIQLNGLRNVAPFRGNVIVSSMPSVPTHTPYMNGRGKNKKVTKKKVTKKKITKK